jgi:hypothetical protein
MKQPWTLALEPKRICRLIGTTVMRSRILVRIKVKSRRWIRIKVKRGIQIRNTVNVKLYKNSNKGTFQEGYPAEIGRH